MSKDAPHKFFIYLGSNLSKLYYRQSLQESDKCNGFFVNYCTSLVFWRLKLQQEEGIAEEDAPARTRTWASGFGGRRSIL